MLSSPLAAPPVGCNDSGRADAGAARLPSPRRRTRAGMDNAVAGRGSGPTSSAASVSSKSQRLPRGGFDSSAKRLAPSSSIFGRSACRGSGTLPPAPARQLEPVMNFAEGFAAFVPKIGSKPVDFTKDVAACHAALAPPSAERLVWRPLSASRASQSAGRNPEVHNRL
jgi:hypothetical protein